MIDSEPLPISLGQGHGTLKREILPAFPGSDPGCNLRELPPGPGQGPVTCPAGFHHDWTSERLARPVHPFLNEGFIVCLLTSISTFLYRPQPLCQLDSHGRVLATEM